jgi:hypothetical protein
VELFLQCPMYLNGVILNKPQLYQITFYQQIDCAVPEKSKKTVDDKKERKIKKKKMERIRKWKKRIRRRRRTR